MVPQECQIVTVLPGGGGVNGALGGNSVGDAPGVPVLIVGEGNGGTVPLWLGTGVADLDGVREGPRVAVAGPGYGIGVLVRTGPGYLAVIVGFTPGPGYCGTAVLVRVGEGDARVSLATAIWVGFRVTVTSWFGLVVGVLLPAVGEAIEVEGGG